MFSTTHESEKTIQHTPYHTDNTATAIYNGAYDYPALCDIKIICNQIKKKSNHVIYLNFIESCPLSSSNDQPCIEIITKTTHSSILLNECISFEYFDVTRNDFQSFIYAYFETYTVSIHFSDELLDKKSLVIKYLEYMCRTTKEKSTDITKQQPPQELSCLTTTENILHTFDAKLISHGTIIPQNHPLIGRVRLYFTQTDLYLTSCNCNRADLNITIANQCPVKDKTILCIPYFTIRHYGNRSNIFLIELGKSDYGNGEIHLKCPSSSFASTIHLLVSPVIEERPLILTSAFQNQLLTKKRIAKLKSIIPPIQLNQDENTINTTTTDRSTPITKSNSTELLTANAAKSNEGKRRSVFAWVRRFVKNSTQLQRSNTCETNDISINDHSNVLSASANKFFELNIAEKSTDNEPQLISSKSQTEKVDSIDSIRNNDTNPSSTISSVQQEANNGMYIEMGPTARKLEHNEHTKIVDAENVPQTNNTVDVGVNTIISLPPHIRSAIIVGTSVHLISEEPVPFPIGQRSFTSPASVMQPFKAQLTGHKENDKLISSTPNTSGSSCQQPISASDSQQSLMLSYGIVTLNKIPLLADQTEHESSPSSEVSTLSQRLNSDFSITSISNRQQPSNVCLVDKTVSPSSSGSHIHRAFSVSTNNVDDNMSNQICASNGSILFYDENLNDGSTAYLIGTPSVPIDEEQMQTNMPRDSSFNLPVSMSRMHLSHINEEKLISEDPYALVEPLATQNRPSPDISAIISKTPLSSEKSIHYTELLLPSNNEEEQQFSNTFDQNLDQAIIGSEEKIDRSATIIYSDIDFDQTDRRDRIAVLASMSKSDDNNPPFVL